MEIVDALGLEIGDVAAFGSIQRLQPEIIDSILTSRIDDRSAVYTEAQNSKSRTFKIEDLRILPGFCGHNRQFLFVLARVLQSGERRESAIWRQVEQTVDGKVRDVLRSSAVKRHACEFGLIPVLDVVDPSIIGRALRMSLVSAVSDLR